jgi:uncharacterized protein involved in exopolysaccharide biosynthesis
VELSFVLSALRRRLWLVALITALGLVPYLLLVDSDAPNQQFRSEAKVDIQQPTQTQGGFIGDPNRYVIGQLAVLESATLVSEVSTQLQLDQEVVRTAVIVEQQPETDVVSVIAQADTPQTAQAIAQAYIDNYMDSLETDRSDLDELARLAQRIQELEDRVDAENARIQEGMEQFVDGARRRTTAAQVMPQIDAVVPDALSSRNLAQAELEQLIATRNSVISNSRLRVNTTVIQNATLPTEPLPQRQELLAAAGLAGGLLLGVVAALAWARFSTKVLDEDTAAEILGVPVVAEMPYYRSLARHPWPPSRLCPARRSRWSTSSACSPKLEPISTSRWLSSSPVRSGVRAPPPWLWLWPNALPPAAPRWCWSTPMSEIPALLRCSTPPPTVVSLPWWQTTAPLSTSEADRSLPAPWIPRSASSASAPTVARRRFAATP